VIFTADRFERPLGRFNEICRLSAFSCRGH